MHPTPDLADEFVLRLELAIPVLCLERVGSGVGGGGVEQKQRVVSALIELLVMRVGDLDELAVEIPSHHGSWEGSNLRRESCRFPNRHSLFVTKKKRKDLHKNKSPLVENRKNTDKIAIQSFTVPRARE